jgi:hypothetical protein
MAILVLPALALVATFWLFFRRIAGGVWTRTEGNDAVRAAFVTGTAVAAAALAYVWWPDGRNYRPVLPGERGTLAGAVQQVSNVVRHRPASGSPDRTTTNGTTTSTPTTTTTNQSTTQTQTPTATSTTRATTPTPAPAPSSTPTLTDTTPAVTTTGTTTTVTTP